MKNVYIDMDGTLADFQQVASEEELFEQGYFASLKPQTNVIEAVKELSAREDIEIYILSAVLPSPYARKEKNEWLDRYLPEVNAAHRIFVPCGEDKSEYIGHTHGFSLCVNFVVLIKNHPTTIYCGQSVRLHNQMSFWKLTRIYLKLFSRTY